MMCRTKVLAAVHVSNLLGEVLDARALVAAVRECSPAAHVVLDGVAYAPHMAIDVAAWGVDWYGLSCYKVWGPHLAALYGRTEPLQVPHDRLLRFSGALVPCKYAWRRNRSFSA